MVTQLPQRWPQIQSAFFDSDQTTRVRIFLPKNPIDGQLVITTNVNDHNGFVSVSPPRIPPVPTQIVDPLTLTRGDEAEITGPNVSIWWQYRAEDDTWYPLGINNDRAQSIKVIDPAGATVDIDRTERSVEVISPGALRLSEPQALRHIYDIKNSCPDSGDIVKIKSSSSVNELKLWEGHQVGSIDLQRGETLWLQSFGTYWLVIGLFPAPAPVAFELYAAGLVAHSHTIAGTASA